MSGLVRGGANRGGGLSSVPPFDSLLVDYWINDRGVALVSGVDSWTSQRQAIAVPAVSSSNRPTYGTDGSNFNARPVVQCAITGSLALSVTGVANVWGTSGTRPYAIWAGRFRTNAVTAQAFVFRTAATSVLGPAYDFTNNRLQARCGTAVDHPRGTSTGAFGNAPFLAEMWLDGTNRNSRWNGTAATPVADTGSLPANLAQLYIGRHDAGGLSDSSHAFIAIYSAKPSDAYIRRLSIWLNRRYGTPVIL